MNMNSVIYERESNYIALMNAMDDDGKQKVREAIEKVNNERYQMELDRKGNIALKKEIERIKMTCPKKVLATMLNLQTFIMAVRDQMPEDVYEGISNLIADPDDDTSLFPLITELIAVCDYTDPTLKRERTCVHHNPSQYKHLTEAQKLVRAQDPEDKVWTMCPKCKRCMTIKYYISDHNGRHVCRRATEAQALSLKEKQIIKQDNALALAKIQIQDVDGINASLQGVKTGNGENVGSLIRGS